VFIPWFAAAYGNLRRLGVQHVPWSDRWAVGAWFIPFVSIWRPKQIANEIWRGSEQGAEVASERWRLGEVSPVVHWWWGLFLAGGFVAAIGAGIVSGGYKRLLHDGRLNLAIGGDVSQVRTGALIAILGAALLLGAVAFGVIFVREATARFEGIRRRLIEAEPVGGYAPAPAPQPLAAAVQQASYPPPPSAATPPPPPPPQPVPVATAPVQAAVPPPPPPSQGLVSCPECAELVLPQGTCPYCGYAFGGPPPPSNR
jgi:hypothetical protein